MKNDIASVVTKEFIYSVYERMVDDPKDYEKVTRKKMIQEVFKYYQEDNHLEECLSYQDILELKNIIKHNNSVTHESNHLYQLLLLDYIDYKNLCINQDILPFIKEKINSFDLEKAKIRDEKNLLLIGMIKGYGIIKETDFDQTIKIFNEINGTDLEFERDVLCNRVVREYYVIEEYRNTYHIVYKIFEDYMDDFFEIQNAQQLHVKIFEKQSLLNIAKYDFDISVPVLNKLYKEIQKKAFSYIKRYIVEYILLLLNMGHQFEGVKNFLLDIPYMNSSLTSKLLNCIADAIDDIPLAIYHGMTTRERLEKEEENEQTFEYLQSVKQAGACLGAKEARYFYKMYMRLLDFVNHKYNVVDEHHLATATSVDPADQIKVRNKLFENLSIIDEYIKLNPYHLNSTLLKQVKEVKNAITMDCIIVKYERNYTLIMDKNNILYAIIGGVSNLDEIIPAHALPYMCRLSLIPYKGKIVYDGVIEGANIQMGSGIQKNIIESIKNTQIHKTLPIDMN